MPQASLEATSRKHVAQVMGDWKIGNADRSLALLDSFLAEFMQDKNA